MTAIIVALAALAVAGSGVLWWKHETKRRDALATLAAQGGWDFSPMRDYGIGRLCDFDMFTRGSERFAVNTVSGRVDYGPWRCQLEMGDFHYRAGGDSRKKGTSRRFSYLAVRLPFRHTPRVRIRREGLFDAVAQAAGFEDIDFESMEFSDKYCVTSENRKFAYALLHARAMEYFLAIDPPELIEVAHGRVMVLDGTRRWSIDEFKKRLNWARNFVSLWPEHLGQQLRERTI